MKKIYLLLLTLLIANLGYAQEVEIGTGTSTSGFPLSSWFGYERSAALYTAAEINQQGNIASVSWYANNAKSVARPIKIYLKTVTTDVLVAQNWQTLTDGATLVYDSSVPITQGWNTFLLTANFNLQSENLLVLVETNYGGSGAGDGSSGAGVRYTTSTSKHLSTRVDTNPPTGNLSLGSSRPNIKLLFGPMVTCFSPTVTQAENITINSATINWAEASPVPANGYGYEVRTDDNPGTPGAIASGTVDAGVLTANISGLSPNTTYKVFVRSLCNDNNTSYWSTSYTFTTPCEPVSTLPYSENFDGLAVGGFPQCWSRPVLYTSSSAVFPSVVASHAYSSPNSLKFQSQTTEPTYAISPAFSQNIETLRVKFRLKREGTSSGIIEVGIMTDANDTSTFQLIQTINPENDDMNEYVINLNNSTITGPNKFIAFKHISNSSIWYYWLDNFFVEPLPSCPDVTGVSAQNITKNAARIVWDEILPVTSNGFIYEIRTSGDPGTPGAIQTGSVESNIHFTDIVNLLPSTEYTVYVRSACDGSDVGVWSEPFVFETLCDYPELVTLTNDTICGTGQAQLNATYTAGVVNWYTSETGGTPIATGNNFTTPIIDTTTSYWVSAAVVGSVNTTGRAVPLSETTYNDNNTGLVLQASEDVELQSVTIYSTSPGTIDIKITNSSGDELYATGNVNVNGGGLSTPNVIPINYTIPEGNGYRLLVKSYTGINLIRESGVGGFPYNGSDGALNVTNGYFLGTSTSYYYFYDIKYIGKCSSPRSEVVATVTEAPELTLSATEINICQGSQQTVTITNGIANYDDFTITPTTGVTGNHTTGWTFNPTETTVYTLTAAQNAGQECTKVIEINVNVNPLPFADIEEDEMVVCLDEIQALAVSSAGLVTQVNFGTDNLSTSSTTTTHPNVLSAYYGGNKVQMLYLASELADQGLVNGSEINSIAFDIVAINSGGICNDFRIKIGNTNLSAVTTTFQNSANLQTVYNQTFTPTQTGWVTFEFTTPFIWDGVSNIIIETAHNAGNSGNGSGTNIRYSNIPFTGTVIAFKDNVTPAGVASLDATTFSTINSVNTRPNVILGTNVTTTYVWSPVDNLFLDEEATVPYVEGTNASTVYFKSSNVVESQLYTVTATSTNNCTNFDTIEIDVVSTPAPNITVTDYCYGNTLADINATIDENETIIWYDAAIDGNLLPLTTALVDGTTYYAESVVNGCPSSSRASVTVNVQQTEAPSVENEEQEFCSLENKTLEDLAINGVDTKWYNSATGGDLLPISTPLEEGTTYYASQTINSCESIIRTAVTPIIIEVEAPTSTELDQLFCAENLNTLADITIEGEGIKWYNTANGGEALALTTELSSGTYYASQTIGGCESSERLAISVEVTDIPAPDAEDQLYCVIEGKTVADLVSIGTDVKWYSSDISTEELLPTTLLTSGTYYASQTIGGCESADRTAITVTIQDTQSPMVENQLFCASEYKTIADLLAEGADVKWYDSENSTEELLPETLLTTGTYYASQTINGCESQNRTMIQVTVQNPIAPTALNQSYCINELKTVGDLEAEGTDVKWYNSLTSTEELSVTDLLTSGSYFATQTINGCESIERTEVVVTIFNTPAPTAPNQSYCASQNITFEDLIASGSNIKWYTSSSDDVSINPSTLVSSGTYFASQTLDGCESVERTQVTVTIYETTNISSQSLSICTQIMLQEVVVDDLSFNQLRWYETMNATNTLPANTIVNANTILFVESFVNGCASVRVPIHFEVMPTIPQPTAQSTQYICGSGTVADLMALGAAGSTIEWFNSINATVPLANNTPLINGTYYVSQKIGNCSSTKKAVAVIIINTAAPINTSLQVCQGTTIGEVDWSIPTGAVYEWFNSPTALTPLANTTVLQSGTYYVGRNQNGCKSARASVQVTVYDLPTAPTGESIQILASPATINDLVMHQTNVIWYASYNSAIQHINALSPTTSLTDGATYYGVIQNENGCYSMPTAVTVELFLGVNELDKSKLKVYPNPTTDMLFVEYYETIDFIEVYNLLGQRVGETKSSANEVQIDLQHLASGTYMLKITSGENSTLIKVVKK